MSETQTERKTDDRDDIERALDTMKGMISSLQERDATGEIAALRRLNWREPYDLTFARLVNAAPVTVLLERTVDKPQALQRLAVIASALAAAPDAHAGWKLGGALAAIRATPQRLGALLNARDETLLETVKRTAARLGREGPLPYRQLGKLLLGDLLDPQGAETLRFEIARDYARSSKALD
jgi:hypothetical protein